MKHNVMTLAIAIVMAFSNYYASALISEDNEDQSSNGEQLVYYTLDPPVPCGDGSPAGFYTDAYTKKYNRSSSSPSSNNMNSNHVINFMFGGGCASASACAATRTVQPYLTSSNYEPASITGSTILSNNPNDNPAMADYVKWNVPYCSQDLWLGSGGMNEDLIRGGSSHVLAVLDHWLEWILEAGVEVDTLAISGVSAGTMAIINHFDQIKQVASAAKVKSLRLILDSSLYPDRIDTNFTPLLKDVVDPEVHPLCFKEASEGLQHDSLSNLPCCLSTHCMLRHDEALSTWARSSESSGDDTKMLLIDASYDSLQAYLDLSSNNSPMNALPKNGGVQSLDGITSTTFSIGEYAGARKSRVVETLYGGERQLGPNVIWAMTSEPGHTVLIPAAELSTRLCESGKLMMETMCMGESDCVFSEYPGGITQICNQTGFGVQLPLGEGLHVTLWKTEESWKRITINGESIQQIISDFVSPTSNSISSDTSSAILLMDSCPGPNCVPAGSTLGNSAQGLIEIEDVFSPICVWLRILVSIIVASIPCIYAVTVILTKWESKKAKNTNAVPGKMTNANGSDVYLEGLSVFSDTGEQILDNVSIHLRPSSLTCLLGKSGSGKSCMLGVLSRQLRSNLKVQYINGTDLSKVECTLMRQNDMGMDNMTPNDYLRSTAKVYGTEEARLNFILSLARPFFPIRKDEQGNIVLDPFNHAPINQLSGGQRRMISIATALFQPSSLLLLDEPLSGIDSASSDKITDLLSKIAKENFMTVLMTLHQPSDDILSKMDKVMVLDGGRILLDRDFDVDSLEQNQHKSAAEAIHRIITQGTANEIGDSTLRIFKSDSVEDLELNDNKSIDNGSKAQTNRSKCGNIRLWQVLPLLERLHLECPPSKQDVMVLPFCYLAISLWGSFDSANPLQAFVVTAALTFIPAILFQYRLVINWGILNCHTWDLEDKRISPLAYLISTFIQFTYIPILVIIVSLSIAYGIFGWPFTGFWDICLFSIMFTITELQFGKMLCAIMRKFQSVASLFAIYTYLGAVVSGFFVNPARIPSYCRWIMYSSLAFWGISGAELTQVAQFSVDEGQCLTIVSCLILNRNSIAQYMGFTTVTTAHVSMLALLIALLLFILIEYFFLLRKVQQRGNFEKVNHDR